MVFKPRPPKRRPRPTPRPPVPKPGRRPGPGVGPKGPLKPKPPGRKPKPGPKGPLKPRKPKGIPESLKKLFDDKRRPGKTIKPKLGLPPKKLPGGRGILRKKR